MEECLKILDLAWTGGPFSFDGDYYSLRDVVVTPAPFQKPHPPLWAAALLARGRALQGRGQEVKKLLIHFVSTVVATVIPSRRHRNVQYSSTTQRRSFTP